MWRDVRTWWFYTQKLVVVCCFASLIILILNNVKKRRRKYCRSQLWVWTHRECLIMIQPCLWQHPYLAWAHSGVPTKFSTWTRESKKVLYSNSHSFRNMLDWFQTMEFLVRDCQHFEDEEDYELWPYGRRNERIHIEKVISEREAIKGFAGNKRTNSSLLSEDHMLWFVSSWYGGHQK